MSPTGEAHTTEVFQRFTRSARELLDLARECAPNRGTAAFEAFLRRAGPLATGQVRRYLASLLPRAASLCPWIVEHDLLAVAGFRYVETAYTALMAWALDPPGAPDIALRVQRAWLRALGLPDELVDLAQPLNVAAEVWTDDGVPDLVLRSDRLLLVVEAKTGSLEHTTPNTKRPQTEAYLDAVRAAHRIGPDVPGFMVFITPGRVAPAARHARATSFAEFALALAQGLECCQPPDDLRAAYATLITHFITYAVPPGTDVRSVALLAERWGIDETPSGDDTILRHLEAIQRTMAVLPFREEG